MDPRSRRARIGARAARGAAIALLAIAATAPPAAALEAACATSKDHEMLALINAERAALGRAPLAIDVRLTAAAIRHAEDMRDHCFLSHTGSDGSSAKQRMSETGYPDGMGEVAASGGSFSTGTIVDAWMGSSGHRAILTHADAHHLGLASAAPSSACGSHFWVGNTGGAPDAEFADALCCEEPGATPICVPEPVGAATSLAVLLPLAALARRRGRAQGSRRLGRGASFGGRWPRSEAPRTGT